MQNGRGWGDSYNRQLDSNRSKYVPTCLPSSSNRSPFIPTCIPSSSTQPPPSAPPSQITKSSTPQPPAKAVSAQPQSQKSQDILTKRPEEILEYVLTLSTEQIESEFLKYDELYNQNLDMSSEEVTVRNQSKQDMKQLKNEMENIIQEEGKLNELLNETVLMHNQLNEKLKVLEKDEYDIPLSSQLPANVLIKQITHENELILKEFNAKRIDFLINSVANDDSEFISEDIDDDDINDENLYVAQKPETYEIDDTFNFESERERYWPLIKSLVYAFSEFNTDSKERDLQQASKFDDNAKIWKIKQEKTERNTKKM